MKKNLKTLISGALAACMVIGATLFTGCATDKKAENANEPPATEQEQIYELGEIKFDSLVPLADSSSRDPWNDDFMSYEYIPIVKPIEATISGYVGEKPELEWYAEWSSGEWGIGKDVSNYITVETFFGTNTEAAVTCLRPFLATIYVYARIKTQPNVKAVCKLNYTGSLYGAKK